jgi:hypothetical protein
MSNFGEIIDAGPFGSWVAAPGGGFLPFVQTEQFGGFVQTGEGQFVSYNPGAPSAATPPPAGTPGGTTGEETTTQCGPGEEYDPETKACVPIGTVAARQAERDRAARQQEMLNQQQKMLEQQKAFAEQQRIASLQEKKESARGILGAMLADFGLDSLTGMVYGLIEGGLTNTAELVTKIRGTTEYAQRFPGAAKRKTAGFNALSESEYIGLERSYRQVLRAAGLPTDFYNDATDFGALIGGDVSVAELSSRINEGYQAVAQASPTVMSEIRRLYPTIGDQDLAAYFLDPQRATPILLRQARAAQIGAAAQEQAQRELTAAQAETLAVAGVTQEQARAGFQTISQAGELFVPLPGTSETGMTVEEQLGGVFGTSAAAQQRLRQRQRERAATFEAGGRFAGQGTTVTGLQ